MNFPHVVNILKPTAAEGSLGQTQGTPQTIVNNWPCKIRSLTGREQEQARTTQAFATLAVEGTGPIPTEDLEQCYLTGGTLKERQVNIAYVEDKNQNGIDLTLFCGESK